MPTQPSADAPPQATRERGLFSAFFAETSPLDLRLIGRTILHAALVGAAAGVIAVVFVGALEQVEDFLLGHVVGYVPLRAHGEAVLGREHKPGEFHPWLLVIIPALGALVSGLLTSRFAPEAWGGGGDAMIEAYHKAAGAIRRRVIWVKMLASISTLGTGGAGGREGPTMQIGAAIGSFVGRTLRVGSRERRILMIAGVAAGMSAVFRTPLGAALLATEVLYRDDFEADALIPALLASVISYSVFISFYGEATLFAHSPRFPFIPAHLPLYGLLALLIALLAMGFLSVLGGIRQFVNRLPGPRWLRPGLGGLVLGASTAPLLYFAGKVLGAPGYGLGLLGGGYGAAQVAITGAQWLPDGWTGVEMLMLLCMAKLLASSLTLGTGGSAGDFAPSLVLGGLFGGAFGRAVAILTGDPRIDPGAFALVGMGTFYGGVAHVPVSSLVMVCELAGSYDLLVPLMLAEGIAFVALRNHSLYHTQVLTQRDSPAHPARLLDILKSTPVKDVMIVGRPFVSFEPATPATVMLRKVADTSWQDILPVLDATGKMMGIITSESLRIVAIETELQSITVAADAMQPPVTVNADDNLRVAAEAMLSNGMREVPVMDADGKIMGFLDEADLWKAYLEVTSRLDRLGVSDPTSSQFARSAGKGASEVTH